MRFISDNRHAEQSNHGGTACFDTNRGDGGSGQFLYEGQLGKKFANYLDDTFVLQDSNGQKIEGLWVTSTIVGANVTPNMLYFKEPEPATATLGLLALTALCAHRRRTL